MIGLVCQNECRLEDLLLFDNTIASIATNGQVGIMGEDILRLSLGFKWCLEVCLHTRNRRSLQKREGNGED